MSYNSVNLLLYSSSVYGACYFSLVVRVHWVKRHIVELMQCSKWLLQNGCFIMVGIFLYNLYPMNLLRHVSGMGSTSAIEATGMPSALNDTVLISSGITGGSQYPSNSVKKSSNRDVYDNFVGTTCFGVTSVK